MAVVEMQKQKGIANSRTLLPPNSVQNNVKHIYVCMYTYICMSKHKESLGGSHSRDSVKYEPAESEAWNVLLGPTNMSQFILEHVIALNIFVH